MIAELIENGHRVDKQPRHRRVRLEPTANNFLSDPTFLPIRFVQPVSCSFGMRVRLAIGCGMRRFPAGPTWTSR